MMDRTSSDKELEIVGKSIKYKTTTLEQMLEVMFIPLISTGIVALGLGDPRGEAWRKREEYRKSEETIYTEEVGLDYYLRTKEKRKLIHRYSTVWEKAQPSEGSKLMYLKELDEYTFPSNNLEARNKASVFYSEGYIIERIYDAGHYISEDIAFVSALTKDRTIHNITLINLENLDTLTIFLEDISRNWADKRECPDKLNKDFRFNNDVLEFATLDFMGKPVEVKLIGVKEAFRDIGKNERDNHYSALDYARYPIYYNVDKNKLPKLEANFL